MAFATMRISADAFTASPGSARCRAFRARLPRERGWHASDRMASGRRIPSGRQRLFALSGEKVLHPARTP